MNVGICLIIKDENNYLEEWLNYHFNLGFNHIFIYDNKSKVSIKTTLNTLNINSNNITIIDWNNEDYLSQSNAYLDCCLINKENYDYILFIDTDEFLYINNKFSTIQNILNYFIESYGSFNGLGISWKMYGQPEPYFESRKNQEEYIYYYEDTHIKSILNPKSVIRFPDPHFASINGNYIDENNKKINSPKKYHTSNLIWIKHIYTRSLNEFKEKMQRVDVNTRKYSLTNINLFYEHNNKCNLK
jgi:hypothetical protein